MCRLANFVLQLHNSRLKELFLPLKLGNVFCFSIFAHGEMAERLIAAVLKTAEGDEPSGSSNLPLSA